MPTLPIFRYVPASLVALAALLFLSACASPASRLRALAESRGFERRTFVSGGFELTVFENAALTNDTSASDELADDGPTDDPLADAATIDGRILHVYLEGDGRPWMYRVVVTPDPTPRRPLMLGLMALDPSPALYLGRPCYNGTAADSGCDDTLWTSARYSATVVESMAGAIHALARRQGYERLRLFGHSGGGTLALLLAARLPATLDVVTIAGNLDPDAWTRHHGYTPLRDSLNPAREPDLDERVRQWHLVGEADRVVPPPLVRPFIHSRRGAIGAVFPGFSHGCCWERVWSDVLRAVGRGDATLLPGQPFGESVPSGRAQAGG